MKILTGFLLVFLSLSACAEDNREEAVEALFAPYDRTDGPGLSVGIAYKGKTVFLKGFGMADLEQSVPITTDTIFHVASVSKQFTAFSIALLARAGKVDLDADIRTYLPYVPDFGHKITVRHLIHHTSGIRDHWSLFRLGGQEIRNVLDQRQIVNMVTRQRALNFKPGSELLYCNTGYALLAEIVRAASGQSLRDYTEKHIFKPLGMTDTFFYDDVTEVVPHRAHGYSSEGKEKNWRRKLLNYNNVGATSLHTTPRDLLKWGGNFTDPVVGDAALIKQITTPAFLDDATPTSYGFALITEKSAGHNTVSHGGSDAGFRAMFTYFPEQDLTVAITTNAPLDRASLVKEIARIYLGGQAPNISPAITPSSGSLDAFAGHYQDRSFDRLVTLEKTPDGLTWNASPVTFRADGTISLGYGGYYKPVFNDAGRVVALEQGEASYDGRLARFSRVEMTSPALEEFIGSYRSAELDATYSLSVEDGALTARMIWLNEPLVFHPTTTDTFQSGRVVLNVRRNKAGHITGIFITTGRARRVLFDRVL